MCCVLSSQQFSKGTTEAQRNNPEVTEAIHVSLSAAKANGLSIEFDDNGVVNKFFVSAVDDNSVLLKLLIRILKQIFVQFFVD